MTEFGSLNHARPGQDRVQPFIRNFCSISCSVLLITALLSNLNIYSPFRLQTTDITVTQPSTCLRLSDNTAGAITWRRRLPEKFCRNPIRCLQPQSRMRHLVNAYEIEQVRCNLQVTLCDPYLSALSVRYFNKGAI